MWQWQQFCHIPWHTYLRRRCSEPPRTFWDSWRKKSPGQDQDLESEARIASYQNISHPTNQGHPHGSLDSEDLQLDLSFQPQYICRLVDARKLPLVSQWLRSSNTEVGTFHSGRIPPTRADLKYIRYSVYIELFVDQVHQFLVWYITGNIIFLIISLIASTLIFTAL